MSPFRSEQFNVWFPAIVVGFLISLVVAALWDFIRRRFWLFVSRGSPGILKEVGLDSQYQSRAEAEDRHQETIDKLNKIARGMNLPLSPKSPNSGASAAIDIEAHTEINPYHSTSGIRMTGTSTVEGTYSISASSQNQLYPGEAFEDMDCRPIISFTSFFPDGTSKDVTRPAKKLYKRYANGRVKRMKSSIILQASIAIDPWVLAKIVELAKHCMQKENRCIFQLGNWAILYHNETGITMRGLYLTGSQVKVGTKRTSKILRSAGPATQGVGDLDELHLPVREFDVPREDSLICASKVVVVNEVSLIVRSEASLILPPREENVLLEAVWTRWLQISNSAKKMLRSLIFGAEDCQPECAANRPELKFDPQQLELSVEHWKGLSQIELLNMRKEVLLHLQEQRASGIIENAGLPSPDSHLIFIRDEHYLECWQKGLRVLNEVIHRNSNDSHSHTHVRVRGGIQFLLGDYESALQDYDLALLNTAGHQSTVLLERALVKCMLGRYSEAMQDVIAVIILNPNVNDIRELQTCIQQILDQQRAFQIVIESGSSCQDPLLPDQEKAVFKTPDLLTGDEWHSGEIGSQIPPISRAGTAGGSACDPSIKESWGVARAADRSLISIAEALKLQLKLTNCSQSMGMNPRYQVRRISFIVNVLEDECQPDDVVKLLSPEDQELLNWQAPTEDLQDDLKVRNDLFCLSGRLCPYKKFFLSLFDEVTAEDGHEQRRGPLPLSCYRHVSCRSAMLTEHSAGDGDVQTLFLLDGTPKDRRRWRRRSHDYIKELVLPEARSPYRAFWLVQWDIVDMWDVISDGQGDPDRGLCSNPTAVERQDNSKKIHGNRFTGMPNSPWLGEVAATDSNGLTRHRGTDAQTNPRMSIPLNEKPWTSRQTQALRASGVDSVFPTNSENSTCGGDSTVDSSSVNAYERKSVDSFHYHNGDEEGVSEVLRSADTHRISEEWNQKDERQELNIENGLQVAVKRGSYHELSRSVIVQEYAMRAGLTHLHICKPIESSKKRVIGMELMDHDLRSIISSRFQELPEGSSVILADIQSPWRTLHTNLEGTEIQSLHHEPLGNLSSLGKLNLSGMVELPNLSDLVKLETLGLRNCHRLAELPNLSDLVKLKTLDIWSCRRLAELPNSLGKLTNLKVLDLWSCPELTVPPDSFGKLRHLEVLNLRNCEFDELPDLGGLLNLRSVCLIKSGIEFLPKLSLNPSLNDIKELQACLKLILDQNRTLSLVLHGSDHCCLTKKKRW